MPLPHRLVCVEKVPLPYLTLEQVLYEDERCGQRLFTPAAVSRRAGGEARRRQDGRYRTTHGTEPTLDSTTLEGVVPGRRIKDAFEALQGTLRDVSPFSAAAFPDEHLAADPRAAPPVNGVSSRLRLRAGTVHERAAAVNGASSPGPLPVQLL